MESSIVDVVATSFAEGLTAWATFALVLVTAVYIAVTALLVRHTAAAAAVAENQLQSARAQLQMSQAQFAAQVRPMLVDAVSHEAPGAHTIGVSVALGAIEIELRIGLKNVGGSAAEVGDAWVSINEIVIPGRVTRALVPPREGADLIAIIGKAAREWPEISRAFRDGPTIACHVTYGAVAAGADHCCVLGIEQDKAGRWLSTVRSVGAR